MRPLFIITASIILSGCGSYASKTRLGGEVYAPVPMDKVELLFHEPDRPYKTIGIVSADGGTWTTPGQLYSKLMKAAGDLGGDAVIVTGKGSYGTYVVPGVSNTVGNATTVGTASATQYGNTVDAYGDATMTANATTYSSPTYGADLPRYEGVAIKYQ